MLVAHRTFPHYHPVTQMTAEELETWFTSPEDGLGVPPNAVEALKEEVNYPSDLLGLNDTIVDVEYTQCNLGTRTVEVNGKARPIFQAHAQLSGRDLLVVKEERSLTALPSFASIGLCILRLRNTLPFRTEYDDRTRGMFFLDNAT